MFHLPHRYNPKLRDLDLPILDFSRSSLRRISGLSVMSRALRVISKAMT